MSNLVLTTNLTTIPETSVSKVDQYGNTMSGAGLAAYKAALTGSDPTDSSQYRYVVDPLNENEAQILVDPSTITADMVSTTDGVITLKDGDLNGRKITPKIRDVTNSDGNWIFSDSSGVPYTTKDLREEVFGSEEIIIREYNVPDGYRTVSDNILLYFDQEEHLTTPNAYESGVWPSPNVLVTATNTLYATKPITINGTSTTTISNFYNVNTNTSTGTLFAVVLKRNGAKLGDFENWSPIYGDETSGYTVLEPGMANVLEAYRQNVKNYSDPTFEKTSAGMQVLLSDLPGSLDRYYTYMLYHDMDLTESDTEPQYLVTYYYSPLGKDALLNPETNVDNLIARVVSHSSTPGITSTAPNDYTGFLTSWSATIEITNIENRLYYQKYDEQGNPVNGATFALYNAAEETDGENVEVYFPVTSNDMEYRVFLADDEDLDNKGTATVKYSESSVTGTYQINEDTGVITVSAEGIDLEIKPAVSAETDQDGKIIDCIGTTKESAIQGANTGGSGTNFFTKLLEGKYILREIDAPDDYKLNTSWIKVLVNGDGVYANAGTAEDGVIVGNGAGFLIPTFSDCASHSDIDETLTWIYTLLRVNTSNDSYDALNSLNILYAPEEGKISEEEVKAGWLYANSDEASDGLSTSEPTVYRPEAMVTYLEYGDKVDDTTTHKIFDYIVNTFMETIDDKEINIAQLARKALTNSYPTTDGQGTLRLYTDVGWSELSILQDYEWGLEHRSKQDTNNSTTYTNLTSQDVYGKTNVNMNLAHLFSNSTFVRVTDPRPIDVELVKVDPTKEGSQKYLTGAEFILYQEIGQDTEGNPINQYYNYDSTNATTSWVSIPGQATTIKFDENSQGDTSQDGTTQVDTTQTVHGLISGTYYLKETKAPSGYVIETQPWKMVLTETELEDSGEPEGAVGKAIVKLYNPDSTENPQTATIYIFSSDTGLTYSQLDADDQPLVLELENTKIYNLPSSGSFGVLPFILAGSLILGFSVYLLIREERQTEA